MYHDVAYTVAQSIGKNDKDIKKLKHVADDKWLKCFKPRSPWDIACLFKLLNLKKYWD